MAQAKTGESKGQPYVVVADADADVATWLQERRKLVTATDMSSVLGVPGARSALETWYQKKDALMARAEATSIKEARVAGHDFEESNAQMFAARTGRRVQRSQQLLRSTRYPWLGCTLDYRQASLLGHVPLETKNVGSRAADEMWPVGAEPHLSWLIQLAVQTIVLDVPWGSISAWLGSPFVHHRHQDITTDAELSELILDEGARFARALKRRSPPKTDPHVSDYEILQRLDPRHLTGKVVKLPPVAIAVDQRLQALLREREQRRLDLAAVDERVTEEKASLAKLIGHHAAGRLPNGTLWRFNLVQVPPSKHTGYSYRTLTREAPSKTRRPTWKTSK